MRMSRPFSRFISRFSAIAADYPISSISVFLGICCALAFAPPANAQAQSEDKLNTTVPSVGASFKIDDLGLFYEVADDVTVSLNRDGTVAYWTKRADGSVHASFWSKGQAATVEDVPGYPNTIAHAINRRGDIAGWMNSSNNPVDSLSTTRGFVRRDGHIQQTPGLGGRDSRVFGLNDGGTLVGAATTASGARHAFVISDLRISDLGTLPSGKSSSAYAINSSAIVVGTADVDGRSNHAVSWNQGKIKDLGTLPRGITSSARAINDRGQVVGFADTADGVHAFLYADGRMRDLGTLGDDPSEASGINNRGDVVGASSISFRARHAFLWRDGRMTDLNALKPKGSPWVLSDAFSINDRGQIVCAARTRGRPIHLLLLTPQ